MPELNPFTPTFGKVPPFAAGRDDVLADMAYAFDNGSGDPNLSTVVVGPRGMGKTALLALIADEASAHGWISASVSAMPGMLDDILLRATEAAGELVDQPSRMRLQEVGIPQIVNLKGTTSKRHTANSESPACRSRCRTARVSPSWRRTCSYWCRPRNRIIRPARNGTISSHEGDQVEIQGQPADV